MGMLSKVFKILTQIHRPSAKENELVHPPWLRRLKGKGFETKETDSKAEKV